MRPKAPRFATVLVVGLAVATTVTSLAIAEPKSAPTRSQWTLAWSDNFNGPANSSINTGDWKYDTGQGIFGNGEIQTMTSSASNVHLDGRGDLDITALGSGNSWTSGRIQTASSSFGAPAGGQMEVSATIKQPAPAQGLGYWPAFWLLGAGTWPEHGEIDILEDVNALSDHSGALHCGNLTVLNSDSTTGPCHEFTGLSSGLQSCPGCQSGYQTYSVIVDRRNAAAQQIRWYLNGHEFFSVREKQVGTAPWTEAVDHGFSIILDLAIGGTYPNTRCGCQTPTAQTTSGGTMTVRSLSVRYWKPGSAG